MPQIRPITDLRNTNEISELCHARREPVFITKNGYGDLVIMSMETYEALTAAPPPAAAPEPEEMCFLIEKAPVWAGVLAEVLAQSSVRGIWNFTNLELHIEDRDTVVENIHFADSLLTRSYLISEAP